MPALLRRFGPFALITAGILAVYWQVFVRLIDAWMNDGNYSHGFLILPIAGYFVWERRARLATLKDRPALLAGGIVFACGIAVLMAGLLGSELFLSRISLILT